MKSFKEYMKEETMPFAGTDQGFVGIEDPAVRDNLNGLLTVVTSDKFITPYIGLERIAKVLANYHIFLPKHSFLEGDSGMLTFPVNQFGGKVGMQNDGEVVTAAPSQFHIFFEYRMGDCGMFSIFCEVVNQEELDELLADVEAELNDETEEEDLDEAVLAAPETGRRKTSGSHEAAYEPDEEDEDDDDEAGLVVAEEQIDEVSKKGLLQYTDTALADMSQADFGRGKYGDKTGERAKHGDKRQKGIYLAVKKLAGKAKINATNEEKDEPPFEPTDSTTNAKTPRNVAKRLAQKAMKQAKEKAANKK